jgi:hypothetical protein
MAKRHRLLAQECASTRLRAMAPWGMRRSSSAPSVSTLILLGTRRLLSVAGALLGRAAATSFSAELQYLPCHAGLALR